MAATRVHSLLLIYQDRYEVRLSLVYATICLQWKFLNCCAFAKEDKLYVPVIFETMYIPHIVNSY